MSSSRTAGEILFEEYLVSQGITTFEHERPHPGRSRNPDYAVDLEREYLFEVKDFEQDLRRGKGGAFDPYEAIREKINEARKKFKRFKDWPCSLVLYRGTSFEAVESPEITFAAMLGNLSFSVPPAGLPGEATWGFGKGGRMIRPGHDEPQNTTISAIITVRKMRLPQYRMTQRIRKIKLERAVTPSDYLNLPVDLDVHSDAVGVIVYENPYARIPLPRHLLRGLYDTRYALTEKGIERCYASDELIRVEDALRPRSAFVLADAASE